MQAVAKETALDRLTEAIRQARPVDLVEFYNELFPETPATVEEANADLPRFLRRLTDYMENGLEIEEILALWNVVFPRHLRVRFDEDTQSICYSDGSERFPYAD